MKKIVFLTATIAIVAVIVFNLSLTDIGGSRNITLSELFNVAQAEAESGSGGGKTCNGATNCPAGHSAETNSKGENTSCCGNDTPKTTGHYHS